MNADRPETTVGDARGAPVSEAAIALIAKWEGFRSAAYLCPAGVPTIGYGTTHYEGGEPVRLGDVITAPAAMQLMRKEVASYARRVDVLVKVPLTHGERGALVSFVYNLGAGALAESTLLRLLNGGRRAEAAAQFSRWNKARVGGELTPMDGLTRRRAEEAAMFGGDT